MRTTLKQLAVRAGVHPSTISRVANQDPNLRISADTRARIQALLEETHYRPDGIARSLKLRQTNVLAVVIPDITNPLFAGIFRGVEDAAGQHGYNVILCNTDGSAERERSHFYTLQARRVDGVIVASAGLADPAVRWLRRQAIPHILVNRYSEQSDAFVGTDDFAGAQLVTEHLVARGHRRIAHLAGPPTVSAPHDRKRGFIASLENAGIEADPALIEESGLHAEGGAAATQRLLALARPPSAIFAVNDLAAIGAYQVAEQSGLVIPDQLAVAGYNDMPMASLLRPPLTTIHVPMHELGSASTEMLIAAVEAGTLPHGRRVFEPELVVRQST
jgi:DNA-binding LacI/PurR family transcriptional regulator